MSGFVGGNAGQNGVGIPQARKDIRLLDKAYKAPLIDLYEHEDATNGWFVNPYWPGGGAVCGGLGCEEWSSAVWYAKPALNTGAISKLGFSGYTRDVNGVIVAGATVRLFRTSDGYMTCQVVSGSDGFFTLDTPFYPDTHFYTAHKADVPEVAGASPSNLVAG